MLPSVATSLESTDSSCNTRLISFLACVWERDPAALHCTSLLGSADQEQERQDLPHEGHRTLQQGGTLAE